MLKVFRLVVDTTGSADQTFRAAIDSATGMVRAECTSVAGIGVQTHYSL